MSSTKRGGERAASDYYVTPVPAIEQFLRAWHADSPEAFMDTKRILDPCAGGTVKDGKITVAMSYPAAIMRNTAAFPLILPTVETMDIRADSPAEMHADFITSTTGGGYDWIISNPPFALASQFIEKALQDVKPGGYVVFLLRLNFFESAKRKAFMQSNPPMRAYVHSERMSFTGDGKQDSVAYMHAIWRSGYKATETILKVI